MDFQSYPVTQGNLESALVKYIKVKMSFNFNDVSVYSSYQQLELLISSFAITHTKTSNC
jgi:hypothetical protein